MTDRELRRKANVLVKDDVANGELPHNMTNEQWEICVNNYVYWLKSLPERSNREWDSRRHE